MQSQLCLACSSYRNMLTVPYRIWQYAGIVHCTDVNSLAADQVKGEAMEDVPTTC
jgi:hypothetical protein